MSGRIQADIEFVDPARMATDEVGGFLEAADTHLTELAKAIEAEFFRPGTGDSIHAYEAV
jgi:hypothetical protein